MGPWELTHHFFRAPWQDKESKHSGLWSPAKAETWADYKYLRADINWLLLDMPELDDKRLERLVIHELTHCLTDEFKQYAMQDLPGVAPVMGVGEMERQVSEIERALWWAYQAGKAEAKKSKKA